MSLENQLYQKRRAIGTLRQTQHEGVIARLHDAITAARLTHPYTIDRRAFDKLRASGALLTSPAGRTIRPKARFLYRLESLGTLLLHARWKTAPKTVRAEHRSLIASSRGTWLDLAEYCDGPIAGPRNFSWWTTHDLYLSDYRRGASRAGITNDKVPTYPVLLRMSAAQLSASLRAYVPSVVEAFDCPVFNPVDDAHRPEAGETISLEDKRLAAGCDEYVIMPIPTDKLEVLPLQDQWPTGIGWASGDPLWKKLIAYY